MRIVDFETYATEHGASLLDIGDAGLHKTTARMGRSTWMRHVKLQDDKNKAIIEKRQLLREQYAEELAAGNIRPPTDEEKLIERSAGHDDNPAVQAARRLLLKRSKG
jgi:hypothetical protein